MMMMMMMILLYAVVDSAGKVLLSRTFGVSSDFWLVA